jgi:hypothetical protein
MLLGLMLVLTVIGPPLYSWITVADAPIASFVDIVRSSPWYRLWLVILALTSVFLLVFRNAAERARLRDAEEARDAERDNLDSKEAKRETADETKSDLQERSIELHVERLTGQITKLRTRALLAFIPGVLLCIGSVAGPWVAYELAGRNAGIWQYMIGGSTIALVLLGSGTALLKHDSKLQGQVQASIKELQYFERVKTGLDCALALGRKKYEEGLAVITEHLLAAPPSLASSEGKAEPISAQGAKEVTKSQNSLADEASSKSDALSSEELLELVRKLTHKTS